ncbi:hypothetical protein G7Z17_g831 [Cylindrodendrum hubeiense]|uniref:CFEM domain-containing protein n=1 Tax=Cylindrodendrum hubeiense TaxID=595255 RepID=A0A9P5LD27_9HYPO|nr:hypothetical protein G7Z17_g831 [Cylindrodendrum hubeiense]
MQHPCISWTVVVSVLMGIPATQSQTSSTSVLDRLPDCALECLSTAILDSTCLATNQTCICENESLQTDVEVCVAMSCTIKESLTTKNASMEYCGRPMRHHPTNYDTLSTVLLIISSLFVIQRFAFKIYAKLGLGPDDWITLITAIISIPLTVIAIYGVSANGLGRDIWVMPFPKIYDFGKYFLILEIIYFAEVTLLKLAMLFVYLRIFPGAVIRRTLWGTIIVNCIFGVVFIIVTAFIQCRPISYFWQIWDKEHSGTCLNLNAIAWSNAGISIALDIWMLAIPLVKISSMNLSLRNKIGVTAMVSVGAFVTVVSILRLRSLVKFGAHSQNPTWEYVDATIWSTIEINVGIICICMPSFRLFLHRVFPKLQSTAGQYEQSHEKRRTPRLTDEENEHFGARESARIELVYSRKASDGVTITESYAHPHVGNDEAQLVQR